MRISIVVPAYNERKTLDAVLVRLEEVDLGVEKEIVIVDDGSTDGTREFLQGLPPRFRVCLHERNRGKGAALRTGFNAATGDLVTIQDADLEYDPQDLKPLINHLVRGEADVVYGSRFAGRAENLSHMYRLGNWFLTAITNLLYGGRLTDMETCYKVIRRDRLTRLKLVADRFDFEPEITAKLLRMGARIVELPIAYRARSASEGKKISWKDGLAALLTLLKYRLLPRPTFVQKE